MDQTELLRQFEGYQQIIDDRAVLAAYATDYTAWRGRTAQIIHRLHPPRLYLRVAEIIPETKSTKTFRLVSADGYLPPFKAGQYITLAVEIDGIRTSRPYSISSSPTETGHYDITVRRIADGFVSDYLLDRVSAGDAFTATAPAGRFSYNPLFHGQDLVFLAGGSGITPFMSMIRAAIGGGLDLRMHLVYGCAHDDDVIFGEELKEKAARHGNFRLDVFISEPAAGYAGLAGFLTAEMIERCVGGLEDKTFYLCGPEAMLRFCDGELERLGIPRRRVRRELAGPPQRISDDPGWPQDVAEDRVFSLSVAGRDIPARAGDPLIVSLEKAGLVIPSACRSGECSLCRTKLLTGNVFVPAAVRLRKSDRRFGYIHPCLTYPLSDLALVIWP